MSRLLRYKESLIRFIKEKSCLSELHNIPDKKIEPIIYNLVKESDLILPILLLTVLNNQNKKNSASMQGYYAASGMQFLYLLCGIQQSRTSFIKKYDLDIYTKIVSYLTLISNRSVCQNLETVKRTLKPEQSAEIFINIMAHYHDYVSYNNILNEEPFILTNNKPNGDILKWYIKDNEQLKSNFVKKYQIDKKSLTNFIEKKVGSIAELTVIIGWLMGGGSEKDVDKVKKVAKHFGTLYKLANDFENMEDDIMSQDVYTTNYVVNYGLQESYELFLYSKEKFIEQAMLLDIFTNTIKELVDFIEFRVDEIVDETSPDLKSSYSNIQSVDELSSVSKGSIK
jgi:hypothetical protein